MIWFKKSMFGFGANSCIKPTKEEDKPVPPKVVLIPVAIIKINIKGKMEEQN